MENKNVKPLPDNYQKLIEEFSKYKIENFIKLLEDYENSFPNLVKTEDVMKFKYSNLKSLENQLINDIESLKKTTSNFISTIDFKNSNDELQQLISDIENNLTEYKDDSKFCNNDPTKIKEGIKKGIGYFTDKEKNYQFYGNWIEDAHDEGVLLKKSDTLEEIYFGKFEKNKDGNEYDINGISINIHNNSEKKIILIIGKSSSKNYEGLSISYNDTTKNYNFYFGTISNGKRNNKGFNIVCKGNNEIIISTGNYVDDLKNGEFKLYKSNNYLVNVTFDEKEIKDLRKGVLLFKDSLFIGNILIGQDKKFEIGKEGCLVLENNDVYKGELENSLKNGKGQYFIFSEKPENIILIEGQFEKDKIKIASVHNNILSEKYNKVFEGEFKNNKPFKGKYLYPHGDEYDGEFNEDGQRHGKGKYTYNSNKCEYEGEWEKDKRHGKGSYTTEGKKVEYEWENDLPIKKIKT